MRYLLQLRNVAKVDVVQLTLSGFVGALSALVFWLIAAKRTDLATVGGATTIALAGTFINSISSFGLTVGLLRSKADNQLSRLLFISAALFSLLGSLAGSALATILWSQESLQRSGIGRGDLFIVLSEISAALAVATLIDSVSVAVGRGSIALLRNGALLVLRVLVVAFYPQLSVRGIAHGFGVTALAVAIVSGLWLIGKLTTVSSHISKVLFISLRAWPSSLLFNGVMLGFPLIVALTLGPEAGAVFFVIWNVGVLANSFVGSATSLGLSRNESHPRNSTLMVLAATVTAALVSTASLLVFGSDYVQLGWPSCLLIALGYAPFGALQFRVMALRKANQHERATLATSITLAFSAGSVAVMRPDALWGVGVMWIVGSTLGLLSTGNRRIAPTSQR